VINGARYRGTSSVLSHPLGDDVVLVDLVTGEMFTLDGVGALAWRHLTAGEPLGRAVAAVTADYDVAEATAREDVEAFVGELLGQGLLAETDDDSR